MAGAAAALSRLLPGPWRDPAASVRARIDARPPEGRLLAWAFAVGLASLLAGLPGALRQSAGLGAEDALAAVIAGRLLGALLFLPLLLYALALLFHLVLRAAGSRAAARETRVAVFWAFVLGIPLLLAGGLLDLAAPRSLALAGDLVLFVAFLGLLSAALAEAGEFRRPGRVFLALTCAAGLLLLGLALTAAPGAALALTAW